MRVQHNITAMNSYRNYNTNTRSINKNLEKLSSGYKINRAGDDAAGLAISEKMRAQITGIEVAQKNAKDGISLVQTAEGALTEVHSMLNRMYQLAEQSANGTYAGKDNATGSSAIDREQLNKEVEQLRNEINRITSTANFNGVDFFTGAGSTDSATAPTFTVKSGNNLGITGMDLSNVTGLTATTEIKASYSDSVGSGTLTVKIGSDTYTAASFTGGTSATVTKTGGTETIAVTLDGSTIDGTGPISEDKVGDATVAGSSSASASSGSTFTVKSGNNLGITNITGATVDTDTEVKASYSDSVGSGTLTVKIGSDTYSVGSFTGGTTATLTKTGGTETITVTLDGSTIDGTGPISEDKVGDLAAADDSDASVTLDTTKVNLQIGAEANSANILSFKKMDMSEATLKIDSASVDISTQQKALDSLANIKNAINKVSEYRGEYGAMQNRLEHTINNLSAMQENLQDAESTIRDTDVADEMMKYTKNSILVQSAQAMLAQANQQPQGVLQLLQ